MNTATITAAASTVPFRVKNGFNRYIIVISPEGEWAGSPSATWVGDARISITSPLPEGWQCYTVTDDDPLPEGKQVPFWELMRRTGLRRVEKEPVRGSDVIEFTS